MDTNKPFLPALARDFISFLKKPDDSQLTVSYTKKLHILGALFLFELLLTAVVILPLLTLIDNALELDYDDFEFDSIFTEVAVAAMLIPFLEELVFRYFLRYKGLKTTIINPQQWKAAFPYLVYISAVCFGMLHATNYSNNSTLFYLLSPLIVLSQLIGGLILSYVRIRLNFFWGVLFHGLWNLFAVSLSYLE